jgi:hypothetical protein
MFLKKPSQAQGENEQTNSHESDSSTDPEAQQVPQPLEYISKTVPGYPRLGMFMGFVPEASMFRRFAALNSQNILYMQAELAFIERQLRMREEEDSRSQKGRKHLYARHWWFLNESRADGDENQLRYVRRMQELLPKYSMSIHGDEEHAGID